MEMSDTNKFINNLYKEEDWIKQFRNENKDYPIIKEDTSRFLITMLSLKNPSSILEVGTCIGFSAIIMAKHLQNTHVTTIERYKVMADKAKINFSRFNVNDKITLIEESAIYALQNLNNTYDFIFLDAAKGQYINFLPHILRLLNINGIIISDNILQDGKIIENIENIEKRQRTIYNNMHKFLHAITTTDGLQTTILPIGDGVSITVKTDVKTPTI